MQGYTPPTDSEIDSILNTVMRDMQTLVNLSDEQVALIRPLQEQKLRKRNEMRLQALKSGNLMEYKAKVDAKTANADPAVLELLNDEQKILYENYHQTMRANNKGGPMASRRKFMGQDQGGQGGLFTQTNKDEGKIHLQNTHSSLPDIPLPVPMLYGPQLKNYFMSQGATNSQAMQLTMRAMS